MSINKGKWEKVGISSITTKNYCVVKVLNPTRVKYSQYSINSYYVGKSRCSIVSSNKVFNQIAFALSLADTQQKYPFPCLCTYRNAIRISNCIYKRSDTNMTIFSGCLSLIAQFFGGFHFSYLE
jgi:hypothetical protein